MPGLLSLNFDVLDSIAERLALATRDLPKFVLTCRRLHTIGQPYLFSTLNIGTSSRLHAVCTAATRNPEYPKYFIYLSVGGFVELKPENADGDQDAIQFPLEPAVPKTETYFQALALLAQVLERATNLRTLSMDTIANFVKDEPHLATAIPYCTRLNALVLASPLLEPNEALRNMLQSLNAPIVTLALRYADGLSWSNLVALQPTLQIIQLSYADFSAPPPPDARWPKVFHIMLREMYVSTLGLMRALPNLRGITVCDYEGIESGIVRELNVGHRGALGPGEGWSELEFVRGDVGGVWGLALDRCAVTLLDIADPEDETMNVWPEEVPQLIEVITETTPVMLALKIRMPAVAEFLAGLSGATPGLVALDMTITVLDDEDRLVDHIDMMVCLVLYFLNRLHSVKHRLGFLPCSPNFLTHYCTSKSPWMTASLT
jgi:hypothetical protein